MQEQLESKKPIKNEFVPTGKDMGLSYSVWKNGVSFQKRIKENGSWKTTQQLNLTRNQLEELLSRIPDWLKVMSNEIREGKI